MRHDIRNLPKGEFQNCFLIAAPRHPVLERTLKTVVHRINSYWGRRDGVGRMAVLRTTGPLALTKAISPIPSRHPYRIIDSEAEA